MKQLDAPPSAEELKEIRLAYKLMKKEMGEVLGVAVPTVTSYETGKSRIPYRHVKRINRLLAKPIPTDELVSAAPVPADEPVPATPVPADEPAHVSSPGITTEELRFLRRSRGLTQKQVAKAYGVSHTSIYAYEHGQASIPKGLADCIKGMAGQREDLYPSEINVHELPHRIIESRAEEREQWLLLSDQAGPADLRKLRHSRGLSESALSQKLGISQGTLHSYETGRIKIPKGLVGKIVELYPNRIISPSELHRLRVLSDLSQAQIANALGMHSYAIQHYEAGTRKITWDISERLITFFQEN